MKSVQETVDGDFWEVTSLGRGIQRKTRTREIIDCTGDADVVRILGMKTLRGSTRQPGAYQYKIEGIDSKRQFPDNGCRTNCINGANGAGRHPCPVHLHGHGGGSVPGG